MSRKLNGTSTKRDEETTPKPSLRLRLFRWLSWTAFGVLIYAIVTTTALALIPMIGALLNKVMGVDVGSAGPEAFVAVWVMPYLFVVGMLFYGEVRLINLLWRRTRELSVRAADWPLLASADERPKSKTSTLPHSVARGKNQERTN